MTVGKLLGVEVRKNGTLWLALAKFEGGSRQSFMTRKSAQCAFDELRLFLIQHKFATGKEIDTFIPKEWPK